MHCKTKNLCGLYCVALVMLVLFSSFQATFSQGKPHQQDGGPINRQKIDGPQLNLSVGLLDFGKTLLNYSSFSKKVELENTGNENLVVSEILTSGNQFDLILQPMLPLTLKPGEVDSIVVAFFPSDTSKTESSIQIRSNDLNSDVKMIELVGLGQQLSRASLGTCYALQSASVTATKSLVALNVNDASHVFISFLDRHITRIAIDVNGVIVGSNGYEELYFVDAKSGQTTFALKIDVPEINGLVFGLDNLLYILSETSVYTIDLNAKILKLVRTFSGLGTRTLKGFAIDPFDKTMWAASNWTVYKFDIEGATISHLGSTRLSSKISDIRFNNKGILFGVARLPNSDRHELFEIDRLNGNARAIGVATGLDRIYGIAFRPGRLKGAQLGLNTTVLSFGTTLIGASTNAYNLVLDNRGTEEVTITEVTDLHNGFIFKKTPQIPLVLSPGSRDSLEIFFAPIDTGFVSANLFITSNDSAESNKEISLSGMGKSISLAEPGAFYASFGSWHAGGFMQLDPINGEGRSIGAPGLPGESLIAINSHGVIYYTGSFRNYSFIDSRTGQTSYGFFSGQGLSALAFDSNDILHGTSFNHLVQIDTRSGGFKLIGDTGNQYTGMAFDPTDGKLWAVLENKVFTVSKATGNSTLISEIDFGGESLLSICFDSDGNLYGVARDGNFFLINKSVGTATLIGATGYYSVTGLAYSTRKLQGPHIGLSTTSIDFGTKLVGDTLSSHLVIIKNVGTEQLNVDKILVPSGSFSINIVTETPFSLNSGQSDTLQINFKPKEPGFYSNSVSIFSNDPDSAITEIILKGEAVKVTPALPGEAYVAVQFSQTNGLGIINKDTGAGSFIGFTENASLNTMAVNSKGIIYTTGLDTQELYYLDATTVEAQFAVETNLSQIDVMAFDKNDNLYAVEYNQLYVIDTENGFAEYIGSLNSRPTGLAFNPFDGKLWGCQSDGDIYEVNVSTGFISKIGNTGLRGYLGGIHFDSEGNLYGIQAGSIGGELVAIEKFSGKGEVIGATGFSSLSALAFYNQPIPGRQLNVSSNLIDFSTILIDSSKEHVLEIRSIGTDTVTVSNITLEVGSVFNIVKSPTFPMPFPPGKVDTLTISFSPATAENFSDHVIISSDDEDQPAKKVALHGKGFELVPADSAVSYAISLASTSYSSLFKINPSTGVSEQVGDIALSGASSLAVNSRGIMYVGSGSSIYYLNAENGEVIEAIKGILSSFDALVFDENDTLYALYRQSLYQIDLDTGNFVKGAYIGYSANSLAFDPTESLLWVTDGSRLYKMDSEKTHAEIVGEISAGHLTAIYFDNDGNLFGVGYTGGGGELFTINKITGQILEVQDLNIDSITSMAYWHYFQNGPQLSISATQLDFSTVVVGDTSEAEKVQIRNFGTENLIITEILVPDNSFRVDYDFDLPSELKPDSVESIVVSFKPGVSGKNSSPLHIISNDASTDTTTLTLSGEGFQVTIADSGTWYSVKQESRYENNFELVTIDVHSGELTTLNTLDLKYYPNVAVDNTGKLFIQSGLSIYLVDATGGKLIELVTVNLYSIQSIAFGYGNHMYVISDRHLYQLDINTGQHNQISINDMPRLSAIAFDPIENLFWGVGYSIPRELYKINLEERKVTKVGDTKLQQGAMGMQFDSEGQLFALVAGGSNNSAMIMKLDRITGEAYEEVPLQHDYLHSLGYYVLPLSGKQLFVGSHMFGFGAILVDSTSSQLYIPLHNIGDEALTISEIEVPESMFSLALDSLKLPLTLLPKEKYFLPFIFSPVDTGYAEVVIGIKSDDRDEPLKSVKLHGLATQLNFAEKDFYYACLGRGADNPGSLITLNAKTGAGTYLSNTGLNGISGIAINPQGVIVGAEDGTARLYYIDAKTGESVHFVDAALEKINAIVFDNQNNLYCADSDFKSVYKVDRSNGSTVLITELNYQITGLAYDTINNMLWSTHGSNERIYKTDLTNMQSTLVGNHGLAGYITGLHFDKTGNLYALKSGGSVGNNQLIAIDVNTGAGSLIGDIGFSSVSGFAIANLRESDNPTSITMDNFLPSEFLLKQNYPNPFNPTTKIRFAIAEKSHVTLIIFNMKGQVVRVLVDEERQPRVYDEIWDAKNEQGFLQASGIYFVRLTAGDNVFSKRIVFVK